MNSIKNIIKHFYFSFRDLFLPKYDCKEVVDRSIAILRVDAIGDYILFRNFIEEIYKSEKYKAYSLTLIGNEVWKSIAEELDAKWISDFIWINRNEFHKNFHYRKKKLKEIKSREYELLFHPTFSRDFYVSEIIAKHIHSKRKVASIGDLSNNSKWQKILSDSNYDSIIPLDDDIVFEFYKNKTICSAFIDANIDRTKPEIKLEEELNFKQKYGQYLVLFLGGSTRFKKWSSDKWIELIALLSINLTEKILLAGAPDDTPTAFKIKDHFSSNENIINACGKTSLLELIALISNCQFMVSNETSAPHIAVALNIPVIVIANGSHYGRFTPYPDRMKVNYTVILPHEIEEETDERYKVKKYNEESSFSLNDIAVKDVYNRLLESIDHSL